MASSPRKRLRRLGTLFLATAVVMLIAGLTLLEGRLRGLGFVAYWSACLLTVGLAALMALFDLILTRREVGQAQRELLEESFRGVLPEDRNRPSGR